MSNWSAKKTTQRTGFYFHHILRKKSSQNNVFINCFAGELNPQSWIELSFKFNQINVELKL